MSDPMFLLYLTSGFKVFSPHTYTLTSTPLGCPLPDSLSILCFKEVLPKRSFKDRDFNRLFDIFFIFDFFI